MSAANMAPAIPRLTKPSGDDEIIRIGPLTIKPDDGNWRLASPSELLGVFPSKSAAIGEAYRRMSADKATKQPGMLTEECHFASGAEQYGFSRRRSVIRRS